MSFLHRLGIDLFLPLRAWLLSPDPRPSDVAVIVIDEETYRSSPFSDRPQVAWTPYLARIIDAVHEVDAKVIGLDLIYPTTLDQADLLPGFDRPLLTALLHAGRAGDLVMGQVRLSQQPIVPNRRQLVAVGGAANLRTLNILIDSDEVVRRYPGAFRDEDGGITPSFGAELAKRAGTAIDSGDFLIDYDTAPDAIPTFSFGDIYHCVEAGSADFMARFTGKIVLIGTSLDLEDRMTPASRFVLSRQDSTERPRCVTSSNLAASSQIVARKTIPGIFIHAAAINTLIRNAALRIADPELVAGTVGGTAILMSLVFYATPPVAGAAAALTGVVLWTAVGLIAFCGGLVLPLVTAIGAIVVTFTVTYAYRFVIEDRSKRWIQHAFSHYLAPALVDRLAHEPSALNLGGMRRRVTILFSDIAGFTTLSEKLATNPEQLVEIMNRYLTIATAAIERRGGYIDKFIGDAVMAIWGAPLADDSNGCDALEAALDCLRELETFNREIIVGQYQLPPIGTRIGINTGDAIVGNMGSATRLNYTVVGDAVNLAARLEGANKIYGSRILIGEETARAVRRRFVLRRLDRVAVKGKRLAVKVFEVVAREGEATAREKDTVRAFHAALGKFYRRDFTAAESKFIALADFDEASRLYQLRCAQLRSSPPGRGWTATYALETK